MDIHTEVSIDLPLFHFLPARPLTKDGVAMSKNNYLYLYEQPSRQFVSCEYAPELCLPMLDVWHLRTEDFFGYYVHTKSPRTAVTNSSIVASSNMFFREIETNSSPVLDLVYSTKYFSAFSAMSGCSMLLRQFNSQELIQQLNA